MITLATKRCNKCGETKPLSEFHRQTATPDGLRYDCKPCVRTYVAANRAKRRAEMGEEAWLAKQARIVKRSRQRGGSERDRAYSKAQHRALWTLVERHRSEYDHLLLLARRGELA